jgi:hypothetical protein
MREKVEVSGESRTKFEGRLKMTHYSTRMTKTKQFGLVHLKFLYQSHDNVKLPIKIRNTI